MLIDSHCHLDLQHFDEDRDAVVSRAVAADVQAIVNPGIDLNHCRRAIALAEQYAPVYAAVGIHPNSVEDADNEVIASLRELAQRPKVVAIGEIGLDYHWDKTGAEFQKQLFVQQLHLAAELGLPVIIHSRDAQEDIATILDDWVVGDAFKRSPLAERPFAGVLHAFSGDRALADRAYQWNFVLSLGGPVTFKNAHTLHTLTQSLRLDRLMLETDAPYLTPHPHRGRRNEPAHVVLVRDRLAELFNVAPQEIDEVTTAVASRFFGLEDRGLAENATKHQVVETHARPID